MAADSNQGMSALSPAKQALLRARLRKPAPSLDVMPRRSQTQAPLSFAQQRLWFLDQFDPHSCAYNVARVFRLNGNLHQDHLQSALNAIVERHEVLRTTFQAVNGEPTQIINCNKSVPLRLIDLTHLEGDQREARALELIAAEGTRPFNLGSDVMLRATVLKLQEREQILVLMTHHIASDGWSKGVLFHELAAFYNAFLKQEQPSLAELPIQYADFAAWQRQWVKGQQLQEQLAYWKKQLEGAPALLELPTDFPRPPVQGFVGATECCTFPAELTQKAKAFSQTCGTTLFTTLLATFTVLLSRYSRQNDIVVGTPIAGRTRPELEPLIGDFVNMMAIRSSLSEEASFSEFLRRVKEVALQAYDNQDLPFEMLVDEIEQGREMSRAPVFQSIFILETAAPAPPVMQDLQVEVLDFDPPTAKNDLILILADHADGLKAKLEYRTDLFTKDTARRFLRHYETLLRSIVAEPDQPVSRLVILPNEEREQVVTAWNQTATLEPLDRCIHQLFEEQCERTPDAIAVQFENAQLSYSELDRRSNQLAIYLRQLGVGCDDRIGLCVHRSLEMIVALLGIMKAGGAYVPLDPAFPAERLAFMLQDAGAKVLLTQSDLLQSVPSMGTQVVCLDRDWVKISRESTDNPSTNVGPANLAYVIFTSGSTGRPKGVQVEHRSVVNFLRSMQREPGLEPSDVLAAVTTLCFDIAGLEIYLPLVTGARLVVVSHEEAADGNKLQSRLREAGVTVMQATPVTWRLLLEAGWPGDRNLKILCGGEAFPGDLANSLLGRCASLWNMYGPTETTIWSSVHRVTERAQGAVPIGHPIANTQIYVLDAHYEPVPVGVPGEIWIAGDGVARGYFNQPELTAEKFVADPFRPAQRMYRTGDLGRFRSDGILECLGRMDHQVKIRGFRIELGEIEFVLMQYPGIRQAAATVSESQSGDKRLLAYVVAENTISTPDLRHFLSSRLPEYMVPSAFVPLEALPLSPNGKLNRSALPDPGETVSETAHAFVSPVTPLETAVAEIFSQVLDMHQVGLHDSFFELGGHSLLATRVVSRLRDRFQIEVTPRLVFEFPRVDSLAQRISELIMQTTNDDEMAAALAELGELGDN